MNVETVHQLQEIVRGRRLELGETQTTTAQRAGVSRKWLSQFERGATLAVELPQLLRILASLSLRMDIAAEPTTLTPLWPDEGRSPDLDRLLDQYLGITGENDGE